MKLIVLPSAWDDLADGYWFYESCSSGFGNLFRESLITDIEKLSQTAGVHRVVSGHHRALALRFPFAIYYTVQRDVVTIRAVLDCRRDPKTLRKKLP